MNKALIKTGEHMEKKIKKLEGDTIRKAVSIQVSGKPQRVFKESNVLAEQPAAKGTQQAVFLQGETLPQNISDKVKNVKGLSDAGFPVPPFFFVQSDGSGEIQNTQELGAALERLGSGPYIVRSAHPLEGGNHPFSGRHESFHGITTAEELVNAYRDMVRQASESKDVKQYVERNGIAGYDPKFMDVLVMPDRKVEIFGHVLSSNKTSRLKKTNLQYAYSNGKAGVVDFIWPDEAEKSQGALGRFTVSELSDELKLILLQVAFLAQRIEKERGEPQLLEIGYTKENGVEVFQTLDFKTETNVVPKKDRYSAFFASGACSHIGPETHFEGTLPVIVVESETAYCKSDEKFRELEDEAKELSGMINKQFPGDRKLRQKFKEQIGGFFDNIRLLRECGGRELPDLPADKRWKTIDYEVLPRIRESAKNFREDENDGKWQHFAEEKEHNAKELSRMAWFLSERNKLSEDKHEKGTRDWIEYKIDLLEKEMDDRRMTLKAETVSRLFELAGKLGEYAVVAKGTPSGGWDVLGTLLGGSKFNALMLTTEMYYLIGSHFMERAPLEKRGSSILIHETVALDALTPLFQDTGIAPLKKTKYANEGILQIPEEDVRKTCKLGDDVKWERQPLDKPVESGDSIHIVLNEDGLFISRETA